VFAGPSFTDVGVVHERFLGFRKAFSDAGVEWDPSLIETVNTTHQDGVALGRRLLTTHPTATAVFATADILAIGLMEGLSDAGHPVPARVSVVAVALNNLSAYVTPKLTTVAQDMTAKAANAVDLLLRAVQDKDHPETPLTLTVHLITRHSTAPPP
jgi:LacI family transcriptional regulator